MLLVVLYCHLEKGALLTDTKELCLLQPIEEMYGL